MRRIATTALLSPKHALRAVRSCSFPVFWFVLRLVLWFGPLLCFPATASAQGRICASEKPCCVPACEVRTQDQIWLINTRHLCFEPQACSGGPPQLEYHRYNACDGWVKSSADAFFRGQNPDIVTTVYVHGNRVTHEWAQDHGFAVYCRLTACADTRPIRHVIWSWPSEPIKCGARVLKDARVKADRTNANSYYLGWWLNHFEPSQRIGLMGFSFGGRTILGAMHLLNGGRLCGCCVPGDNQRVRPRIAIWACASESTGLCLGGCNDRALAQIDRGLVIYNPNDPALRRYQRVIPGTQSPALGLVGVPCCASAQGRLWQMNAGSEIGKVHRFKPYMQSNCLVAKIREYALWPDAPHGMAAPPATHLSTASQISKVPVNALITFDLAATMRFEALRYAYGTPVESEAPVAELPTFELAPVIAASESDSLPAAETAKRKTELR